MTTYLAKQVVGDDKLHFFTFAAFPFHGWHVVVLKVIGLISGIGVLVERFVFGNEGLETSIFVESTRKERELYTSNVTLGGQR